MAKTKSTRSRDDTSQPIERASIRSGWRSQMAVAMQEPSIQLAVAKHKLDMAQQNLSRQVAYRDVTEKSIDALTKEISKLEQKTQ